MIPPVVRLLSWLCLAALMSALIVLTLICASLFAEFCHLWRLERLRARWVRRMLGRRA